MPWTLIRKGYDAGREEWQPDTPGAWPPDEPPPGFTGIREPLPPPCPICTGRLLRTQRSDELTIGFRHERAMKSWQALGAKGPPPVRETPTTWLAYRLDHFTDCRGSAPLPGDPLRVSRPDSGDAPDLIPARRVQGDS
jgi:hypothetical protein